MSSAESVVRDFLGAFDSTDSAKNRAIFEESITDDCQWANTGFPTAEGKEACLATWDGFFTPGGLAGMRVQWVACAVNGDTVVTERVDHLLAGDGSVALSIPVAGTLVARDGKIAAWRDYWDPRPALGG